MSSPPRLGLFGGSFDPVHTGHLHAARAAQAAFELDRVVFVPAARPPHKPGRALTDGWHRLAMIHIAIEPEPRWSSSDLELLRSGPSFTVDTLRELPARMGEPEASLWMILGSDNLQGLERWHEVETLLTLAHPIVVLRGEDPQELPGALREHLSDAALERLTAGLLRLPPAPGRSTDLRGALAGGSVDLPELPAGVREYIRAWGLYPAGPA